MEVPAKIEHLILCTKAPSETFRKYVHWFQTLAVQMKETLNLKEIICPMNVSAAAWYLMSASNSFDELFDIVLNYEELMHSSLAGKAHPLASVNHVMEAFPVNNYNYQNQNRGHPEYSKRHAKMSK